MSWAPTISKQHRLAVVPQRPSPCVTAGYSHSPDGADALSRRRPNRSPRKRNRSGGNVARKSRILKTQPAETRIHRIERPVLPFPHFVDDRASDPVDDARRDIGAVEFGEAFPCQS
jgi:hypothetical protein